MKKPILIIILFALCVSISSAGVTDKLRAVIAAKNAGVEEPPAPSYLHENGFEATGVETSWSEVDNSGGTADDWDCTTGNCPLVGSESYRSPDPVSGQNKIRLDFGLHDEVWVAFRFYVETVVDADANPFRFRDSTDTDVAQMQWQADGDMRVDDMTDWTFSIVITAAADVGLHYIMLRCKKGTGNDAELEFWETSNTASWTNDQSSISSTDGDFTNQLRYFIINNYFSFDGAFVIDQVVVDDEAIPITYFQ